VLQASKESATDKTFRTSHPFTQTDSLFYTQAI